MSVAVNLNSRMIATFFIFFLLHIVPLLVCWSLFILLNWPILLHFLFPNQIPLPCLCSFLSLLLFFFFLLPSPCASRLPRPSLPLPSILPYAFTTYRVKIASFRFLAGLDPRLSKVTASFITRLHSSNVTRLIFYDAVLCQVNADISTSTLKCF